MCLGEQRIIRNEPSKQKLGAYGDTAACKKGPSGFTAQLMLLQFRGGGLLWSKSSREG